VFDEELPAVRALLDHLATPADFAEWGRKYLESKHD